MHYSDQIADQICERLIEGESMRQICSSKGFPSRASILRWMDEFPDFEAKCARARVLQADLMDDRVLEVANNVESGALEPKAGSVVLSALQWRASKLAPKKYGDKLQTEHSGEVKTIVVKPEAKDATPRPTLMPDFEQ
jgi:hypothetical protein